MRSTSTTTVRRRRYTAPARNRCSASNVRSSSAISTRSSTACAYRVPPGPRLSASSPRAAKSATFVHACFGSSSNAPARRSCVDERSSRARRVRAASSEDLDVAADELAHARLGVVGRAVRRVAEVQGRLGPRGDDVRRDPGVELRHRDHLAEEQPFDLDVTRLGVEHCRNPSKASRIAFTPSQGRAECAERPSKTTRAFRLPRQPSCRVLSVGSRQITSSASSTSGVRSKTRGKRVLGRPELLAREEEEAEVVGEVRLRRPPGELDHHREAALHVARAQADDGAVLDATGQVSLGGDGVRVPGEQHERLTRALGEEQRSRRRRARPAEAPRPERTRRTAASDLDSEGMLTRASVRSASAEIESEEGIIDDDDSTYPGARARVRPRGAGSGCGSRRRAGRGEGACADGRRRAGRLRRAASRPAGAANLRRQGQARGAQGAVQARGRGERDRRRRARSVAAALPRERARRARRRPHAADPRHLRAARDVSAEGKLQVELAQLEYNLPRMRGMWQHLERLGGGTGALGAASARGARASRSSRPTGGSRATASRSCASG